MLNKLRVRLVISHILPLAILAPVLGFTLLYLWENVYFLNDMASELVAQARIIADVARDDSEIWVSPAEAEKFVSRIKADIPARLMLLNKQGKLLYSSANIDENRIGQSLDFQAVLAAQQQQTDWSVTYNNALSQRIVDVAVPVLDSHSNTIGIVRLSYGLADIEQRLIPLRWIVLIGVTIALLAALVLALVFAHSLSAPLTRLTRSVSQYVPGTPPKQISEMGPNEVRTLAVSFNQVAQRLYEFEIGRRELLASLVHELGNPLGAIRAAAEALQNGASADPLFSVELAEGMISQIDQLSLLLDDLTLLGAAEVNGFALHKQWIRLDELIQAQCHSHAYLLRQKHISLTCEFRDEPVCVFADGERICQIFSNLISNAYKYTPSGGKMGVGLEKCFLEGACWVVITVADNGPGISPSEQKKIFSLFYRSPQTRKTHRGMGIGLALSQQLAEAHNGSLTLKSSEKEGTTFYLRLPIDYASDIHSPKMTSRQGT